jgi:hypothetical protein
METNTTVDNDNDEEIIKEFFNKNKKNFNNTFDFNKVIHNLKNNKPLLDIDKDNILIKDDNNIKQKEEIKKKYDEFVEKGKTIKIKKN